MIKRTTFILLFGLSAHSWSQDCKFDYPANAKSCPTSGSNLLDDTYPVASYVISIGAYRPSAASSKVPGEFVLKMLEGHNFAENSPSIIIPSEPIQFAALKEELEKKIKESNGRIPASIIDKVVSAPAYESNYTWQQDYFESFFDPRTGKPVLRGLESYDKQDPKVHTDNIAHNGRGCGITEGAPLVSDHYENVDGGESFGSGEMGGNIEGLPGGLCLTGDNQSAKVSSQYCGDQSNVVQTDVSWLSVGHVDEVMKVMPTRRPGVPAECNFSLTFASPKKALELLAEPKAANHNFFSGDFLSASSSQAELAEFRTSRSSRAVGGKFCEIFLKYNVPAEQKSPKTDGVKKAFYFLKKIFVNQAFAGIVARSSGACEIEKLTNAQFLKAMQDEPEFRDYNRLVQEKMDANKKKVVDQVLARLPQCQEHLSIIDVPDLFYGRLGQNVDGSPMLPMPGVGGSFFPNPTNSVVTNDTIVFSDPQNPLFRDYLTNELRDKGMRSSFMDTWDYAHLGDGNLHCSSHSLPYCAPVAKGSK